MACRPIRQRNFCIYIIVPKKFGKLNIQNVVGLPIKIRNILWKRPGKPPIGMVDEYLDLIVLRKEQKEILVTMPADISNQQLQHSELEIQYQLLGTTILKKRSFKV